MQGGIALYVCMNLVKVCSRGELSENSGMEKANVATEKTKLMNTNSSNEVPIEMKD